VRKAHFLWMFLLFTLFPSSPQSQVVAPCEQVQAAYTRTLSNPSSSRNWVRRLVAIISFSETSRLDSDDDRVGAIENLKLVCTLVNNNSTMSAAEKQEFVKKWIAASMTMQQTNNRRSYGGIFHLASSVSPGNFREYSSSLVPILTSTIGIPAAPMPPPQGAIRLKLFPKSNLGLENILRLRSALPDFDIRQGSSRLNGTRYAADVMFVMRDKVTQHEVLRVAQTLKDLGIDIKSIQQRTRGPDEIQVGTIVMGSPAFSSRQPLDLLELGRLAGNEFWKAAFNGQAWCDTGVGSTVRCSVSEDGRPVRLARRQP
jgi:hypothetical protein